MGDARPDPMIGREPENRPNQMFSGTAKGPGGRRRAPFHVQRLAQKAKMAPVIARSWQALPYVRSNLM